MITYNEIKIRICLQVNTDYIKSQDESFRKFAKMFAKKGF